MIEHLEEYRIPNNIGQALKILQEQGDRAAVVAGGTVQALRLPTRVRTLVDLMRCGLDDVRIEDRRVHIGATTVAGALAAMPELDALGSGVLREAAAAISAQPVRNQVTVAGNILGTMSWADIPVALLVLDARVRTARPGGTKRTLELDQLLAEHPRKVLERDEIIMSIEAKPSPEGTGGAFIKLSRTVADLSVASAAAALQVKDGVAKNVRIALGAVQPRAGRAKAAESILEGQEPTAELVARAAEVACQGLRISSDLRGSKEYRRRVASVTVRRALETAVARAKGEARYDPPRRPMPAPWTREPAGQSVGKILNIRVDGAARRAHIQPGDILLDVLRRIGIKTPKRGCNEGYCGTCAVLVNGRLLNACLLFAAQVDGCEITTAAGIGTLFEPHALQTALVARGAVQCGFCTPGMVVAGLSLLEQINDPTDDEIKAAMDGNLCRCTGYVKPIEGVKCAAEVMRRTVQDKKRTQAR